MWKTAVVIGIALGISLAAAPARAFDACDLLTTPDADEATIGAVTRVPAGPANACYYQVREPAGDGVSLELIDGGRAKFDFDHKRMHNTTALSGIGDAAFEFVSLAGFAQVYAVKGDTYFVVTLTSHRNSNLAGSAARLARKVADRIKSK